MHSYHSLWLRLSLFFTLLSQLIRSPRIRNERTKRSMCAVGATTQLNVWPTLCRPTSTLVYANSFGTLDHFKVDCKAEEVTEGQHLVIMMMGTSVEKDSQASSILRVCYELPIASYPYLPHFNLIKFLKIAYT